MSAPPANAAATAPATSAPTGLTKPSTRITNYIKESVKSAFFSHDVGVIIFFVGIFLVVGLGLVILFENAVPGMRSQLLTNFIGIGLGIVFIVIVFNQMGKTVEIAGRKIDLGMIYYLGILMIVMLLFSS